MAEICLLHKQVITRQGFVENDRLFMCPLPNYRMSLKAFRFPNKLCWLSTHMIPDNDYSSNYPIYPPPLPTNVLFVLEKSRRVVGCKWSEKLGMTTTQRTGWIFFISSNNFLLFCSMRRFFIKMKNAAAQIDWKQIFAWVFWHLNGSNEEGPISAVQGPSFLNGHCPFSSKLVRRSVWCVPGSSMVREFRAARPLNCFGGRSAYESE